MITLTRQQALARQAAARRQRQVDRSVPTDKAAAAVTSIYMLKLPIPGAPGQEPVSRNAVTVVDAPDIKPIPPAPNKPPKSSPVSSPPAPPLVIPTRQVEEVDSPLKKKSPDLDMTPLSGGERGAAGPFSRPFVKPPPSADTPPDEPDHDSPAAAAAPFLRPFAPADQEKPKSKPVTRPVPKPSDKARPTVSVKQAKSDDQELAYEPVEDDEYDDDEGRYDDLVVP